MGFAQFGRDAPWFGDLLVDPCGYADRPLAVEAPNARGAGADFDVGHGAEGHGLAISGSYSHALQVAFGLALGLRVAHHDAHIVLSALDPLDFFAEKGLADLAPQVLLAQAQHFGFGPDVELQLTQATFVGVANVKGAGVVADAPLQFGRGGPKLVEVATHQLEVQIRTITARPAGPADLQRAHAGNVADLFTPAALEFAGRNAIGLIAVQFDQHAAADVRAGPGKYRSNDRFFETTILLNLLIDLAQALVEQIHVGVGQGRRCALVHFQVDPDEVTGKVGEEDHPQKATSQQAQGQDQHANEARQGNVAIAQQNP
jgi:hypothetical protein